MLRPYVRICLIAFVIDFAVMVGITATPFFVYNQLGGSAAMSGTIGAVQAACYALTCLLSARFVSRAKNGLSWAQAGVVLYTVLYSLVPFFRSPVVCGGVSALASAALAMVWPALHSWVGAEPDPKTRARNMGWFNISWSFGFALSPLIAGPFYDLDYRLPFALLFLLGMGAFALVLSMPHERHHFAVATEEMLLARADHDRASEAYLYCGWSAVLVANALTGVTRTIYPKRVDDLVTSGQLRLLFESIPSQVLTSGPATKYSWLAFVLALATALTFLVMGRTTGWRHRFQVLLWIQIASAAAFWVLARTRSLFIMMVCFGVVGVYLGVAFFSGVYYSLGDPRLKHRRAAINEGAVGIGGFAGSMIVGYLAGRYGMALPLAWTPWVIAATIAIQAGLIHYGRNAVARRQAAPGSGPTPSPQA